MTSVKVHFLLEDLLVEAPEGADLRAVAEASGADVTFGCGSGSCGTCRVRVMEGLEHCSEAGSEEKEFLRALQAPADHRLACQVRVNGDLEIEYLGL